MKICHKLVAKTAKEITGAAFEILSSDDKFHRAWPHVRPFVAKHWKDFIGHARASLAVMLQPIPGTEKEPGGPRYTTPQIMRDEIYEAFLAEGGFKAVPQPPIFADGAPSAAEIARYGRLN